MPCHGRCLQKASVKLRYRLSLPLDATYLAARELLRSVLSARSRPSKAPSASLQAQSLAFDQEAWWWRSPDGCLYLLLNAIRYFTGEEPGKFAAIAATATITVAL